MTAHPDGKGKVVVQLPWKGKDPDIWGGILADAAEETDKNKDDG